MHAVHGDHICSIYETRADQIATATAYTVEGLRRGERCLFAGNSQQELAAFRAGLAAAGYDPKLAEASGALMLLTKQEAHLAGGRFDCERMLRMLNDGVESALNAGFSGFRTCGDMSWLLDNAEGAEQVLEYESLLNQFFSSVRAVGMCQYDRSRLADHFLGMALATHSSVVLDRTHKANPFYRPAAVAVDCLTRPADVHWKLHELRRRPELPRPSAGA